MHELTYELKNKPTYRLALDGEIIESSATRRKWWLWFPVGWWDFEGKYGPFFSCKQDKMKWEEWEKFKKRHQVDLERRAGEMEAASRKNLEEYWIQQGGTE